MPWQEIIQFLGGTSLISLTIGFLGKKAIDAFVAGRFESYKANLEKIAIEHSFRFQSLHSARAEVIKEFYEKLALLDDHLSSTLRPFQSAAEPNLTEKVKELSILFNELREYFLPKRIFFEESVCELIDSILDTARGVFYEITTHPIDIEDSQYKYHKDLLQERHEFWEKARSIHAIELAQLKQKLENEFRKILGIKMDK